MTNRLGVRSGPERRRRLEKLAEESGGPISEAVRNFIDAACDETPRARREQNIERLIWLNVADLPEPDTMRRELGAAQDRGGLRQRQPSCSRRKQGPCP